MKREKQKITAKGSDGSGGIHGSEMESELQRFEIAGMGGVRRSFIRNFRVWLCTVELRVEEKD